MRVESLLRRLAGCTAMFLLLDAAGPLRLVAAAQAPIHVINHTDATITVSASDGSGGWSYVCTADASDECSGGSTTGRHTLRAVRHDNNKVTEKAVELTSDTYDWVMENADFPQGSVQGITALPRPAARVDSGGRPML